MRRKPAHQSTRAEVFSAARYENLFSARSEQLRRDGGEVRDVMVLTMIIQQTSGPLHISSLHLLTPPGLLSSLLASLFLPRFPEASF